jgi:protease IV
MDKKEKRPISFFRMLGTAFMIYLAVSLLTGLVITARTMGFGFGNVAVVEIKGVLTTEGVPQGLFTQRQLSSADYVRLIDEAARRNNIDAIVLEIDSPGGSAVASYEVVEAIKRASESKPVVAYIREVGASGAYWAASASDYIIIQDLAITGSVGVVASYLEFSGLFEKYGVGYVRVTGGEYKDLGSPFRNLTDEEAMLLQAKIDELHMIFSEDVIGLRGLNERSDEELRMIRSGIFFTAREALSYGLVDEIGQFDRVSDVLRERYDIQNVEYSRQVRTGSSSPFGLTMEKAFSYVGLGIGESLSRNMNRDSHIIVTT